MTRIISIGEVLWDCFPEGERLGGAPLNFAVHARRLGHRVVMVSAVGDDARGRRALRAMRGHRIDARLVTTTTAAETGHVSVTIDSHGEPRFVIHRPAAYDLVAASAPALAALRPRFVYHGTLAATQPGPRALLEEALPLLRRAGALPVYDVNLRPGCWDGDLVRHLLGLAAVVKMNENEAGELSRLLRLPDGGPITRGSASPGPVSLERFCRALASRHDLRAVCVTRGDRGCALLCGSTFVEHAGYRVRVADTVGAGDAFAAALVDGLARGWSPARMAARACRLGALVASRRGAVPRWRISELDPPRAALTESDGRAGR